MQNFRLTFIALSVADLPRSVRFYRDWLGLPLEHTSHDAELNDPWYGGDHAAYSWTQGAFMHFALYPARLPQRPVTTGCQIGFHLTDFAAVHERMTGAGVEVVQSPRNEPWGQTVRYLDPDANIVSITQAGSE